LFYGDGVFWGFFWALGGDSNGEGGAAGLGGGIDFDAAGQLGFGRKKAQRSQLMWDGCVRR